RDAHAFEALVERHYPLMIRIARSYVRSSAVVEEVVQDARLPVLKGIDRVEGRSALKTWIVSIGINRAKTESRRAARSVPLSTLAAESGDTLPPTGARSPRAGSSGRRRCRCSRRRSRRCPRRSRS